jgi:hypothetical protein
MSDAIGPGDWVEALYSNEDFGFHANALYTVREVLPPRPCEDHPFEERIGLKLVDMPDSPSLMGGWCSCCFRPIRSDITEIERLLTVPAPKTPVPA